MAFFCHCFSPGPFVINLSCFDTLLSIWSRQEASLNFWEKNKVIPFKLRCECWTVPYFTSLLCDTPVLIGVRFFVMSDHVGKLLGPLVWPPKAQRGPGFWS